MGYTCCPVGHHFELLVEQDALDQCLRDFEKERHEALLYGVEPSYDFEMPLKTKVSCILKNEWKVPSKKEQVEESLFFFSFPLVLKKLFPCQTCVRSASSLTRVLMEKLALKSPSILSLKSLSNQKIRHKISYMPVHSFDPETSQLELKLMKYLRT